MWAICLLLIWLHSQQRQVFFCYAASTQPPFPLPLITAVYPGMHNFSLAWQLLVDNICVLQMPPGIEISHVNELSFYTVAMELTRVLHALIRPKQLPTLPLPFVPVLHRMAMVSDSNSSASSGFSLLSRSTERGRYFRQTRKDLDRTIP